MENTSREIWVRIPSRGRELHTGLSRAYLFQLVREGKIKSASLKKPGCMVGVRLLWLPSLFEFIERHAVEGGAS